MFGGKVRIFQASERAAPCQLNDLSCSCFITVLRIAHAPLLLAAALGMKRTWISEHAMLALHVWLLANRFKVDYNCSGLYCGRRMQEQLFERFWEDTTLRIRNAGVRWLLRCTTLIDFLRS